MNAVEVWIIIVNYRTATLAVECLRSIAMQSGGAPSMHAVVVDNASGDDSIEVLSTAIKASGWSAWVTLIPQESNGGFAKGNNAALRYILESDPLATYIMLLNPDTVLADSAIVELTKFLTTSPEVGIVGSRILDIAGKVQCSAHNKPSPLGELEGQARLSLLSKLLNNHAVSPAASDVAHECDWVSGASLMVRREVFDQVGLLDEGFFLYFEEVDFCIRARAAGWKVWFIPRSTVVHSEGAATGIGRASTRRPAYWYASRRRYFLQHYGVAGLLAADVLWAIGRMMWVSRKALRLTRNTASQDPSHFARDLLFGDLAALLCSVLHGKRRPQRALG